MWQLIINGPGYFDTPYDLPEGDTTLGRADENDIVLSGDLVSRQHARFRAENGSLMVEDLGSRNGTRLNGEPLTGGTVLRAADTVLVGENSLSVRQSARAESPATELVDAGAGGVRRFGHGADIGPAVVVSRNVRESIVLRALDNILPFAISQAPVPSVQGADRPVDYESLVLLYKAVEALQTSETLESFLEQTALWVLERVGATTAVILLRHPSGVMIPAVVRHRGKLGQGEVPVSDAIIEAAVRQGAALAVADVREDIRFKQRDSVLMYGADQVLCVPIGRKEPFSGVLYLNRPAGDRTQLEPLIDLCAAVGQLVATGIEKFERQDRTREEDRVRSALERFFPPQIAERRLADARLGSAPLIGLESRTVTVLCGDLAGFSALVRGGQSTRVTELLSEFHRRMTGILFSFEATVDKFVGDSLVAAFGTPYPRGDDALRAIRAAMAMRAEWGRLMDGWPDEDRCPLRIGLSSGPALAGLVGPEGRFDHTVVGDAVHAAAWIAGTAEGGQILISGKTLASVGGRFDVTPLGERPLRSGRDKVSVFEVLEEDLGGHTNPGV